MAKLDSVRPADEMDAVNALTYLNRDGSLNRNAMHAAAMDRAIYMATPWQRLPPAHARHVFRCAPVPFDEAMRESLQLVDHAAAIQQDVFRAQTAPKLDAA